MDEQDLLRRAREGRESALEELFRLHADRAVRVAYVITQDWREAEDAAQEAFLRAFRFLCSLEEGAPFLPWFTAILVNEARRARDRKRPPASWRPAVPSQTRAMSPEDIVVQWESAAALRRALGVLDETHRIPIALKYFMDLSESDIAGALGLPLTTVKSRLFVARRRLQDLLKADKEGVADAKS